MWSVPPVTLAKGLSAKIKSKTETDIASKHMRKHWVCPLKVKKEGKAFHLHSKSFAVMSTQGKKKEGKAFHLHSKRFAVMSTQGKKEEEKRIPSHFKQFWCCLCWHQHCDGYRRNAAWYDLSCLCGCKLAVIWAPTKKNCPVSWQFSEIYGIVLLSACVCFCPGTMRPVQQLAASKVALTVPKTAVAGITIKVFSLPTGYLLQTW